MRRVLISLIALLSGLALLLAGPLAAHADDDTPSSWAVDDYAMHAQLQADGSVEVTLDLAFDFSDDKGHGPYVVLPTRQRVADNPELWRVLGVEVGTVTSPSGADATTLIENERGTVLIRVGDEDKTYTGIQTYRINYTLTGLVDPRNAVSGMDELNWNAIGTGWQVPIRKASVTLDGPSPIEQTHCFQGKGYKTPCTHSATGSSAVYSTSEALEKEHGLQIVAMYPAGTFASVRPEFTKRYTLGNTFPITPLTGGLTALIGVLGAGTVAVRARRRRDEVYAGLTPGLEPLAGAANATAVRSSDAPVAVAFTPPKGATPGEVGTLIDSTADNADVTATLVDLAVRGHLRIEKAVDDDDVWEFQRLAQDPPATKAEQYVLETMFKAGDRVSTDQLRKKKYMDLLPKTREKIYARVTDELGWYRGNPETARTLRALLGVGVLLLAGVAAVPLAFAGFGLVSLGLAAIGIAILATYNSTVRRTAAGSAMYDQAKGFELYLTTAEADQIRFEEGIDVFSRYLPYAIVFGVADRWVKIFEKLAAEGRYEADTSWCGGFGYGYGVGALSSSIDSITSSMSSAMDAAVAAGSSGSGSGGGGGAGGGGGGGW